MNVALLMLLLRFTTENITMKVLHQSNVASVGSVFNDTRKVKILLDSNH